MLTSIQVRIIANACIARWKRNEGTIQEVLDFYNLNEENKELVKNQIILIKKINN